MSSFFHVFVAVYAALFPVVNPLGSAPIFVTLVQRCSPRTRELVARKVAIFGFLLLVATMVVGAKVLLFFGVTLPVLRVAGGLVVASVGWHMLHSDDKPADKTATDSLDDSEALDQAFYPLTLPLTVGPGAIATAIALSAGPAAVATHDLTNMMSEILGALAGLFAISLTVYFCFREAPAIERVLGRTGTSVLIRLFAFILLAIGLQIVWIGVHELINDIRAVPA
ncbi:MULTISPECIES: MarC family protein [unclassified Xanthobacter]|uniref:MarC family protein n=1 Tax=unclassified Xanthobacter TaxID=2623496 RepID=UPI001EDF2DC9|nr:MULTISPECIES: MarC family protein [unclassified Xanthobacter]